MRGLLSGNDRGGGTQKVRAAPRRGAGEQGGYPGGLEGCRPIWRLPPLSPALPLPLTEDYDSESRRGGTLTGMFYRMPGSQLSKIDTVGMVGMVGFKAPSRRDNSKPLAKTRTTRPLSSHLSHLNAPSPTLNNLPCSFLPLLGKVCGPLRTPPLWGPYMPPTNQQKYPKITSPPTNQQVSRCIVRPPFSLGYESRHDHTARVGSPWSSGSHPAALAASLASINELYFLSISPCSINSSFFSP